MDFLLIAYILVSLVLILGTFFIYFTQGKPAPAALVSLGFLAASITFGVRWFPGGSFSLGGGVQPGAKWPPTLSVCPDYLTLIHVSGTPYCIDQLGVSRRNGTTTGMTKYVEGATDTASLFNLSMNTSGEARIAALVSECQAKGVTWEGVYNGAVGLNTEPPKPAV
jgi:hypothetical protein